MPSSRPRLRVIALALALLLLSVPAYADFHTNIEPRDYLDVCGHDPNLNPPFFDVGVPHNTAVNCAARLDLVQGVGDGLYHPWAPLRRDQAATVVRKWLEAAFGFRLPDAETQPFVDLDENVHADAIALLADLEILNGVTDDQFFPSRLVTRGQLATLLRKAISYADQLSITGELPPDATVPFHDIANSVHSAHVQAVAAIGVLTGFGDGSARPHEPVTRGQLATFLMRAAAYLDTFDRWEQTATTYTFTGTFDVTDVVDDETVTVFRVPVRLVVYGFTGEIDVRINLTERDTYLTEHHDEADANDEEPDPLLFAEPGLTLTRTDGPLVTQLANRDTLTTQAGVFDTVISENRSTTRFSVIARNFADYQLQLSIGGRDALLLPLSAPE